jgi:hypothetical protein
VIFEGIWPGEDGAPGGGGREADPPPAARDDNKKGNSKGNCTQRQQRQLHLAAAKATAEQYKSRKRETVK